jgi:hypothetical protein
MTMPISILIALIAGLTIALYFTLVPLRILSRKEFIVSHGFIIVGIFLVFGWIWLNKDQFREATMVMGGIWTLFGGLCFVAVYALRRLGRTRFPDNT